MVSNVIMGYRHFNRYLSIVNVLVTFDWKMCGNEKVYNYIHSLMLLLGRVRCLTLIVVEGVKREGLCGGV